MLIDDARDEFKRFAPHYAQDEAEAAFEKVLELQMQGILRPGLYYVVLVDLVGSTAHMVEHGNEATAARIEYFITSAIGAISQIKLRNLAVFLKEIGDAVLLLFQTFPDVIAWQAQIEKDLSYAVSVIGGAPIQVRTCIHVGDVLLDGVNPISLAVSQLFKIEKDIAGGDIALTAPAYFAAWPTLGLAYHAFGESGEVEMDGYPEPVKLYRLLREQHTDIDDFIGEGHVEV